MRVIKPLSLGLLTRPFEYARKHYLAFSVLAMVPLGNSRALQSEMALWTLAAKALGRDGVLDEVIPKRRAEFLLAGHAWPGDDPTRCRVRVKLGDLEKTLNVLGDRSFTNGGISEPGPFEKMPLTWQSAFGGENFRNNPLGKGSMRLKKETGQSVHPLPNVEYPNDMLGLPGQETRPASFLPIDQTWPQRMRKVGTYDQDWLEKHFPAFAPDMDWSFFNVASEDQQSARTFVGDETYILDGLHPERPRIEGALPGMSARVFIRRKGSEALEEIGTRLTTVWFFPEMEHAVIIYHGSAETFDPHGSDVELALVAADELQPARTREYYDNVLVRRLDEKRGVSEALNDSDLLPDGVVPQAEFSSKDLLAGNQESIRMINLRRRLKTQLEESRQALEAEGLLTEEGTESPDIPDVGINLEDPIHVSTDEMQTLIEKLESESRKMQDDAQKRKQEAEQEIRNMLAKMSEASGEPLAEDRSGLTGPPAVSAKRKESEIREGLDSMRSSGLDVAMMEDSLLGEDMLKLLSFAEESAVKLYRGGAHLQDPVPPLEDPAALRSQLMVVVKEEKGLDRMDFTGGDFSQMDLSGANLTGAFLESADFRGANLQGAVLDNAVLARANFEDACLSGASLRSVNLGRANLARCTVSGADLTDSILFEADLTATNLHDCKLAGCNLARATFSETNLAQAQLPNAVFMKTSLKNMSFRGADLSGALLLEVDVQEVDFSEAKLDQAVFIGSTAAGARFDRASMRNVRVVKESDFTGASFKGTQLPEANLRCTELADCDFSSALLDGADLSESNLNGAVFNRCSGKEARWIKADLRHCDLSGANLMKASLEMSDLRGASLKSANLFQADLARVHVDNQTIFEGALTDGMRTYPRKFPKEP